jgi:hypothetical protein
MPIVAQKLIQKATEFGFDRCDLCPEVWFRPENCDDSVLATPDAYS